MAAHIKVIFDPASRQAKPSITATSARSSILQLSRSRFKSERKGRVLSPDIVSDVIEDNSTVNYVPIKIDITGFERTEMVLLGV
uniref:Kinesin motor domain-containing protein n=1 Tax=Heterorhabditis bacteriophora TaxID=37862 RepID=A0A1I7WBV6_HETBA